jgi:sulfite exporter TauE/SafE
MGFLNLKHCVAFCSHGIFVCSRSQRDVESTQSNKHTFYLLNIHILLQYRYIGATPELIALNTVLGTINTISMVAVCNQQALPSPRCPGARVPGCFWRIASTSHS